MNKQTETLKLALEALEETRNALAWFYDSYPQDVTSKGNALLPHVETVLTAIREALAEQLTQQQEPVAWMVDVDLANYQGQSEYRTILAWNAKPVWSGTHEINEVLKSVPLYTALPRRKPWVGLTDEEMRDLEKQFNAERVRTPDEEYLIIYPGDYWTWQRAIEAKLKEKNQ